jgi:hypothetical protein
MTAKIPPPEGDDAARYCHRWMLLDNLVHERNMLRGVLGEPCRVHQARLSRTVCDISLGFGGTEAHLSWVDLPGISALQAGTGPLRARPARHADTPVPVPAQYAAHHRDRPARHSVR